jgi:hypothetical protein
LFYRENYGSLSETLGIWLHEYHSGDIWTKDRDITYSLKSVTYTTTTDNCHYTMEAKDVPAQYCIDKSHKTCDEGIYAYNDTSGEISIFFDTICAWEGKLVTRANVRDCSRCDEKCRWGKSAINKKIINKECNNYHYYGDTVVVIEDLEKPDNPDEDKNKSKIWWYISLCTTITSTISSIVLPILFVGIHILKFTVEEIEEARDTIF